MNICVVAGMIDAKLHSKLIPLQNSKMVSAIHLVRRQSFIGKKIVCHSPPSIFRWLPLAELWRLISLIYIVIHDRPAVLISFGVVPHGIYTWMVGKLFRIPVIQHVMGKNDLRLTFPGQRGKRITLSAVRGANLIAVRGKNMGNWLINQGIPKEKMFIPSNVHDFDTFKPLPEIQPDYDLIYVGLLASYKRVDILLEAIKKASISQPNIKLLIVGDGPLRSQLEQDAKALGIKTNVHFLGLCNFEQLPEIFNRAETFIMTSQGEGLPMAMIEAMSCGLPAIIAKDADIEEIAIDGKNSILVDEWDAQSFSEAILEITNNSELYEKLRLGALSLRKQYKKTFSLSFQTQLWEKTIIQVTQK